MSTRPLQPRTYVPPAGPATLRICRLLDLRGPMPTRDIHTALSDTHTRNGVGQVVYHAVRSQLLTCNRSVFPHTFDVAPGWEAKAEAMAPRAKAKRQPAAIRAAAPRKATPRAEANTPHAPGTRTPSAARSAGTTAHRLHAPTPDHGAARMHHPAHQRVGTGSACMNRDTYTFPLFAAELLPTSPWTSMPTLPAHWSTAQREGFVWYCQNGNQELQEMCAASLWKSNGFTYDEAHNLVRTIRAQPITPLHESPPCAHFARPMASAEGAAS